MTTISGNDPNRRLRRKVRILEEMLEERSRKAFLDGQRRDSLNALLHLSINAQGEDQLLGSVLEILLAQEFLSIENSGAIFLVDTGGRALRLRVSHNFPFADQCRSIPLGKCLCGYAAATGKVVFADSDDPGHPACMPGAVPHGHYCVPIKVGDHVLGVMCLHVPVSLPPGKDDRDFLDAAADILAGTLQRLSYERELAAYQADLEEMVEEKVEELRAAEQRYFDIFNNSLVGVFQTTEAGAFLTCNPAMAAMLGYDSPDEVISSITDIGRQLYTDPEDRRRLMRRLDQGPVADFETRMRRRDGGVIWVRLAVRKLDSPELGTYLEGNMQDITGQRQAQEALAAEKERLLVTLRSIGDGVIVTDTEGRVTLMNKKAEQMTGWNHDEAMGRFLPDVFYIINEKSRLRCVNPVEKVIATGGVVGLANHTVLISKDGRERNIADSGAPIRDARSNIIGVILVFQDVTEQYRMEKELQRSQQLESLGILAGGIAHDFNNILTAIMGNISLAGMIAKKDERLRGLLEQANQASQQAKGLVSQLLTFSKGGEPVRKTASLEEIIRETATFVLRGSNVACRYQIPDDLWLVDVDAGQISQVVQNLVINARQAMTGSGAITIRCENVGAGEAASLPFPLQPGRYVRVVVADEGPGIEQERLDRIFDPYFTTKKTGSGLGLAIVHSIIKKHDGHITVTSAIGRGTEFVFYVPVSMHEKETACEVVGGEHRGEGRILIMDDDHLVGPVLREMLSWMHYDVTLVRDGEEAISHYLDAIEEGRPFKGVIMDLTIPGGMGGAEAVRELLKHDPGAKVLVASGYANNPILANHKAYGFVGALVKPFVMEELAEAMTRITAPSPATGPPLD